jgi:hypothetical protein
LKPSIDEESNMTVSELIELLKSQPQDLQVIYGIHSEYCLLEAGNIAITEQCEPRADGWVACRRPDKPKQKYLNVA